MAKLTAKYRVDCDAPGMQIPGVGGLDGQRGASVILPGTILVLGADFEPRACMTPLNPVAEKAFEKKREKTRKAWTESLAKGETPDGQPLDPDHAPTTAQAIAAFVEKMVRKVGPLKPKVTKRDVVKRERPRVSPGSMRTEEAEPEPDEDQDADDDMLPEEAKHRAPPNRGRASDQQS